MTFSPRQMVAAPAVRRMPAPPRVFDLADPYAGTLAARDTSVAWMTFMGIPQQTDGIDTYSKLADYSDAPADVAWVMACVSRIFNAAASTPLRVYVKNGKDLTPLDDDPTPAGDDLQYLLDNVNPVDMTGSELRGYTAASRKVWGGWYWQRVRGRLLHDTQELYWLRVPDVTPKSQDGRSIDYYEYRPHGPSGVAQAQQIQPKDMIRHRGLNLASQIDMVSPLSAARFDMVTDSAASMHTASILRRRGVPEGYWSAAKGVELTRTDQSAIRRFIRQLVGPRNAGKSLIAPDIEYHPLALSEQDAQWLAGRKVSRMMVSAILGVPLVLAGDDEKAGVYASIRDAQRVFWKDTMIPELDADADTLNNWLVPEFNRPGDPVLVVGHDYSAVESIKPLWAEEWNGYLSAVDHQVVVPNEMRSHFRLGADVPWGNKPVPRTQISYRPNDPGGIDLSTVLPFMEPGAVSAASPDQAPTESEPAPEAEVSETLRTIGSSLYNQLAVKAFLGGRPLDANRLLGAKVSEAVREVIEEGLRNRHTAAQIAARIAVRQKADPADVVEAVLAELRKQWPESELDIVKQGTWTYEPKLPLKKINADRRPVARNPKIVEGVEAQIKVGAPLKPLVVVHTKVIGEPGYKPIDGWHRAKAADNQKLDDVPAFVGEGTPEWTEALLKFNDTIPTPPDSAGPTPAQQEATAAVKTAQNLERLVTRLEHMPAPIVNVAAPIIPAPIVNVTTPEPKPTVTVKEVVRDENGNMVRVVEATK